MGWDARLRSVDQQAIAHHHQVVVRQRVGPLPLMAIYVLMTAGSYRCGDTDMTFSTAGATGAPVVVQFTRIED